MEREKSILVIDDSQDMLELNKLVLETDGFSVTTARSGTEALMILKEQAPPDLILLDMFMTGMSGLEFLEILEDKRPEIIEKVPIVFLSGMEADQATSRRATGVIRKGMNTDQFLEAVHRYI